MTRIQLARDDTMARTVVAAGEKAGAGKTVVLVAGNGHVRRDLGVPLYLPKTLAHRVVMAQAGAATDSPAGGCGVAHTARSHRATTAPNCASSSSAEERAQAARLMASARVPTMVSMCAFSTMKGGANTRFSPALRTSTPRW